MDAVYLTTAFCPTPFTGMGAVVKVNASSGTWHITGKFALPHSSIGCPLIEQPRFSNEVARTALPQPFSGRSTHLSWASDWGRLSVVDLDAGKVTHTSEGKSDDG